MKSFNLTRIKSHIASAVVAISLAVSGSTGATEISKDSAVLRWLDKVTGRVNTHETFVGQTTRIGALSINVQTCMTRPPEETPENSAFLKIWENRPDEDAVEVFSGWMFASSPALSAMDHPVYDVWVLDCKDRRRSILE